MTEPLPQLLDLLFSDNKPQGMKPIDLALLAYLVARQTSDHFIWDSRATLAERLCCHPNTISASVERLEKMGLIVTKRQHDWNATNKRKTRAMFATIGLAIRPENLPSRKGNVKRQPTEDAIDLAAQHTENFQAWKVRQSMNFFNEAKDYKRLPKRWQAFQQYAAQKLIDALGMEDAFELVNYAIHNHKAATKPLNWIVRNLAKIRPQFEQFRAEEDAA